LSFLFAQRDRFVRGRHRDERRKIAGLRAFGARLVVVAVYGVGTAAVAAGGIAVRPLGGACAAVMLAAIVVAAIFTSVLAAILAAILAFTVGLALFLRLA
jgi:hypothetical protein